MQVGKEESGQMHTCKNPHVRFIFLNFKCKVWSIWR